MIEHKKEGSSHEELPVQCGADSLRPQTGRDGDTGFRDLQEDVKVPTAITPVSSFTVGTALLTVTERGMIVRTPHKRF